MILRFEQAENIEGTVILVGWLVGLIFYVSSNSYHSDVGTVSSPHHTFSWASLTKQLTSILCTYFCL